MDVYKKDKDGHFAFDVMHIHDGGWNNKELYFSNRGLPAGRWVNYKFRTFPEIDATVYGCTTEVLIVDNVPMACWRY